MPRAPLLLAALLALAACGGETAAPETAAPETPAYAERPRAPRVVLSSTDGPVDLGALAGHPVVVHLAPSDALEAWAAFEDAALDLEAAGATVVAVAVPTEAPDAVEALGYDGVPLALVIDGEGVVRGRGSGLSGDALFALASPVLAEADLASTVSFRGVGTLEALVAAGGMVVDVSEPGDPDVAPPHAVRIAADTLEALDLPADLGTPIAFVGPDAAEAAERTARWGYVTVYRAGADGALEPVRTPPRPGAVPRGRAGGARG